MTEKYQYLKSGQWESCQAGTKAVLSDDESGSGCIMTILVVLLVLVVSVSLWIYIV